MQKTKKRIVILGATGSIGINALKIVERYPERFEVVGLTAYNNLDILEQQIRQCSPAYVAVGEQKVTELKRRIGGRKIKILNADSDLSYLVTRPEVDVVVLAMRGSVALEPFLSAARHGKTIAPANKEALVIAGHLIMAEARRAHAKIIPVDSEQSAIFQCLEGHDRKELKQVHLTASGGPLHRIPKKQFPALTVSDILKHPRWKMGKKITVDSATLLNKGFEVIEAIRLFDLKVEQIKVLIHPEAIIHSMVEFQDGSVIAQLGITDMRLPIQYALTYPQRWTTGLKELDFVGLKQLSFEAPDYKKFPALGMALEAARRGGTYPSVLNAADEIAVEAFLAGRISFVQIQDVLEDVMARHQCRGATRLQDILKTDAWAREEAERSITKLPKSR